MQGSTPEAKDMIRGFVQPDIFKDLVKNLCVPVLPEHPVAVGASWEHVEHLPEEVFGKTVVQLTISLDRIEEREGLRCAVLQHKGTIKGGAGKPDDQGTSYAIPHGTVSGTIWYALEDGRLVEQDVTHVMTLLIGETASDKSQSREITRRIRYKLSARVEP